MRPDLSEKPSLYSDTAWRWQLVFALAISVLVACVMAYVLFLGPMLAGELVEPIPIPILPTPEIEPLIPQEMTAEFWRIYV